MKSRATGIAVHVLPLGDLFLSISFFLSLFPPYSLRIVKFLNLDSLILLLLQFPFRRCLARFSRSKSDASDPLAVGQLDNLDVVVAEEISDAEDEDVVVVPKAEISISSAPPKAKAVLLGAAATTTPKLEEDENDVEEETVEVTSKMATC